MAARTTHTSGVSLQGDPSVYREIEVTSTTSLYHFAAAIVAAFGFDLFGFYSKLTGRDVLRSEPRYELFRDMGEGADSLSVRKTMVDEAFEEPGDTMLFLFDYGDDWRLSPSFSESVPRGKEPATHGSSRIEEPHPSSTPIQIPRFTETAMEGQECHTVSERLGDSSRRRGGSPSAHWVVGRSGDPRGGR
jgi:hypothetical protein